jgi:hypothetical protein
MDDAQEGEDVATIGKARGVRERFGSMLTSIERNKNRGVHLANAFFRVPASQSMLLQYS